MIAYLILSIDCEQVPGVTDLGLVPRQVKKIAILGGGLMGSGIATALILSNYPVILKEVNDKFLQAGIGRVRGNAMNQYYFKITKKLNTFLSYDVLVIQGRQDI